MRLWTLHPRYLDVKGLVALWREALLAKAVLRGETRGYKHHPQLSRFQEHETPLSAINTYLGAVYEEACARGYNFDAGKVGPRRAGLVIPATSGQIEYEWEHLMRKLRVRDRARYEQLKKLKRFDCHPLFRARRGPVADWERP